MVSTDSPGLQSDGSLSSLVPIPRRQRRRQETQGIDEVGRHRRAKLPYPFGTLDDGFDEGMSLIPKLTDLGAQRIATKFDPGQPS